MNSPERRKEMKRRTCTTCVFNHEVLIFGFWQIRSPSAPSKNWPFQGRQLLLSENHLFKSCMKKVSFKPAFYSWWQYIYNTFMLHWSWQYFGRNINIKLFGKLQCKLLCCKPVHLLFFGAERRFWSMTFLFWYCIELLMPFWEETKICWVYPLQLLWRLEYSVRRNKVGATQLKLRAPLFGLAPVHAFVGALPIIAQRYPKS